MRNLAELACSRSCASPDAAGGSSHFPRGASGAGGSFLRETLVPARLGGANRSTAEWVLAAAALPRISTTSRYGLVSILTRGVTSSLVSSTTRVTPALG